MKITSKQKEFEPITITLETREEAKMLKQLLLVAECTTEDTIKRDTPEHRMLLEIMDFLFDELGGGNRND